VEARAGGLLRLRRVAQHVYRIARTVSIRIVGRWVRVAKKPCGGGLEGVFAVLLPRVAQQKEIPAFSDDSVQVQEFVKRTHSAFAQPACAARFMLGVIPIHGPQRYCQWAAGAA
jgi:hypothetical protein